MAQRLGDAYTGGMPSYGVVLLVLLLFLRRYKEAVPQLTTLTRYCVPGIKQHSC
jgi:hypothetical protein